MAKKRNALPAQNYTKSPMYRKPDSNDLPSYINKSTTRKTSSQPSSASPSALDRAMGETLQYGLKNAQNRADVASTLNGGMTTYNTGDKENFNWNTARQAVLDRQKAIPFFRQAGLFDDYDYASNQATVNLVSSDYLSGLQDELPLKKASAVVQDDYNRALAEMLKVQANQYPQTALAWQHMYDNLDAMDEETSPWFWGYADYLQNGGKPSEFDPSAYNDVWDAMTDEEREQDYARLEKQFAGLDWDTLTDKDRYTIDAANAAKYAPEVPFYDAFITTVNDELERRASVDKIRTSIRSAPGYGEMSTYVNPGTATTWDEVLRDRNTYDGIGRTNFFLNAPLTHEEQEALLNDPGSVGVTINYYVSEGYDYLTEDELKDYNYLYNTGRFDEAKEYLELLRPELLQRRATVNEQYYRTKAVSDAWSAIGSGAESIAQGVGNAFMMPFQAYETATGRDNPYSAAFDLMNAQGWTRDEQLNWIANQEGVSDLLLELEKFGYSGFMGAADNFARLAAAGFNPTVSLIFAGAQGASGSLHDMAGKDADAAAKLIKAFTSGAYEIITEKIGLDALFDMGKDSAIKYFLSEMASELGEETVNTLAEDLTEVALSTIFDYESEIKDVGDLTEDLLDTIYQTAGSTLFMGAGGALNMTMQNRQLVNQADMTQIASMASGLGADTDAGKLGRQYAERLQNGEKLSINQKGALIRATIDQVGKDNAQVIQDTLTDAIENRLVELGEPTENAKQTASAISRMYLGETLSLKDRTMVNWSDNADQVVRELHAPVQAEDANRTGKGWVTKARQNVMVDQINGMAKTNALNNAIRANNNQQEQNQQSAQKPQIRKAAESAKKKQQAVKGKHLDVRQVAFTDENGHDTVGEFQRVEKKNGDFIAVVGEGDSTSEVGLNNVQGSGSDGLTAILEYANNASYSMSADQANYMIKAYQADGGDAARFIETYEKAYFEGYTGLESQQGKREGVSAIAFEQGKKEAAQDEQNRVKKVSQAMRTTTGEVSWIGKVNDVSQITGKGAENSMNEAMRTLSDSQKNVVKLVEAFAEKFKVDVVLYESNLDSPVFLPNGQYVGSTNTVYLDVLGGANDTVIASSMRQNGTLGNAMLRYLGHELTHAIESGSAEGYAAYRQAVREALRSRNMSYEALVREELENAQARGVKLTLGGAEAEVIAKASEFMLENTAFIKSAPAGVKTTIQNAIRDFAKKVREVFAMIAGGNRETRALRELKDGMYRYVDNLQKLWDVAAEEMVNGEQGTSATFESESMEIASVLEDVDGQKLFSLRSMEEDKDTYRQMLTAAGVSSSEIQLLFNVIDETMKIVEAHKEILDFGWDEARDQRSFNPVKANSDPLYKVSVDFSSLCRKRLLQQAVQERLEAKYNTVLTKAERVAIRNALADLRKQGKQIEVACGLCYVESARLKSPAQIQRFFADRRAVLVDYMAKTNKEFKGAVKEAADKKAAELGYAPGTSLRDMSTADANKVREVKRRMNKQYTPTSAEEAIIQEALSLPMEAYTSANGLWELKRTNETIFDAYTLFVRNATRAKGIERDTAWWAGDSESISDSLIEQMNAENGLRSQSWSDFQTIHLLDYMAAVIELSTRNAKMQTYTKVADFVKLMGDTGIMINLSLIPDGFNGETLTYDPNEGMPIETALMLREMFPDTAGTICIGITDGHIRMLLNDSNTDYVIPYHRSGLDKKTRQQMGLKQWESYENSQNEKKRDYANTDTEAKEYRKPPRFSDWYDYETVSNRAKEVGAEQAMREAAERYIDLCHRRGLQEKFPQFSNEENYWKLLIDRKMINQKTGAIINQQAVKPRFSIDRISEILSGEVERFNKQNKDFDEAVAYIEQEWQNGAIRRAAKSKKVQDAVEAYDSTVIVNNIIEAAKGLEGTKAGAPVAEMGDRQFALRDGTTTADVRDIISGMDITDSMNETEKDLLTRYKNHLAEMQRIQSEIDSQQAIIDSGSASAEEKVIAENRKKTLNKQRARENGYLRRAEGSDGFARLMATSHELARTLSSENAEDAALDLEEQISGITMRLEAVNKRLNKTESVMGTELANSMFDPRRLAANARQIKGDFLTTMSAEAIRNRLAVVYTTLLGMANGSATSQQFATELQSLAEDIYNSQKAGANYQSDTLESLSETLGSFQVSENEINELKSAYEITFAQYKKALAPYIKVSKGGQGSQLLAEVQANPNTPLASLMGDTMNDMDALMTLYDTATNEKDAMAQKNFQGMTDAQSLDEIKLAIVSDVPGIENNGRLNKVLRKVIADSKNDIAKTAAALETEIKAAKKLTSNVAGLWSQIRTYSQNASEVAEYYRALEEKRKLEEMADQKQELARQLKSESAQKLMAKMTEEREMRNMKQDTEKRIRRIARNTKDLSARLVAPTDAKHIPQQLKDYVTSLLSTFVQNDSVSLFAFTQAQADRLRAQYAALMDEETNSIGVEDINNCIADLASLSAEYQQLRAAKGWNKYKGVRYYSLDGARLENAIVQKIEAVMGNAHALVVNDTKAFIRGRNQTFRQFADKAVQEATQHTDTKRQSDLLSALNDSILQGNLTPVYFFSRLNNEAMSDIFGEASEAMLKTGRIVREANSVMEELQTEYHVSDWMHDPALRIRTEQGHQLELTRGVALSLYATAKREALNPINDTHHLDVGGFEFENPNDVGNGHAAPHGLNLISAKDMEVISGWLTEEQKAFADKAVEYLSTTLAEHGNESTMAMYGYHKFNEKYYFPFRTSRNQQMFKVDGNITGQKHAAKQGFTISVKRGASTPIIIGDFLQTVSEHAYEMAYLSGTAQVAEKFNHMLNYRITTEDGQNLRFKMLLRQKYGDKAYGYLEDFIRDLNGGRQNDNRHTELLNTLASNFRKTAVMYNLSVIVQQPMSVFRAYAYINPKHFATAFTAHPMQAWNEMLNYSGAAIAKDIGGYNVGMGRSGGEYIRGNGSIRDAYGRYENRARGTLNAARHAVNNNVIADLPQTMDILTWSYIWNAVKNEQAALHPGMDTSSQEFLEMCGKRADDVLTRTQVYDSVLTRSGWMRSTSRQAKSFTAFMAEPTLTANMLFDAFTGKGYTTAQRARAVGSVFLSMTLTAAAASIAQMFRKDDDDRSVAEKFVGTFVSNLTDSVDPIGMLPFAREIQSALSGEEVERNELSNVVRAGKYISKAFGKLWSGEKITWKDVETSIGGLANILGIPAQNVSREMRSVWNAVTSDWSLPSASTLKYAAADSASIPTIAMLENMFSFDLYDSSNSAYYDRIAKAYIDGDTEEADELKQYLLASKGVKSEKTIDTQTKTALRERYLDGKVSREQVEKILVSEFGEEENDAYWKVEEWEYKDENGSDSSFSRFNDLYEAVESGQNLKTTISSYNKLGYDKGDLRSAVTSKYKNQLKELYKSGSKVEYATLKACVLTAYTQIGYDRADMQKEITKWEKEALEEKKKGK